MDIRVKKVLIRVAIFIGTYGVWIGWGIHRFHKYADPNGIIRSPNYAVDWLIVISIVLAFPILSAILMSEERGFDEEEPTKPNITKTIKSRDTEIE